MIPVVSVPRRVRLALACSSKSIARWLYLHHILILILSTSTTTRATASKCRSYCGNITVDYPFGLRTGCGHSGFRDLLFCINNVLMFHIPSGSYRVLNIDYAYPSLILHDPYMSDCYSLSANGKNGNGNGFVLEPWRNAYLSPSTDNVFFLLNCRADSPLFQGFPDVLPYCRAGEISGMGCDDYYRCPAWLLRQDGSSSSSSRECCSVAYGAFRGMGINLTHLGCDGYTSAYSLAPVKPRGPGAWSYGIRVTFSVPPDHQGSCRACQDNGGDCGYDAATAAAHALCICAGGRWNSTSTCQDATHAAHDHHDSSSVSSLFSSNVSKTYSLAIAIGGILISMAAA